MKNTYADLIDQTYYFPQEGFDLRNGYLHFHGVSIEHLIEQYGTPFRLTYLPKIGDQIKRAKNWFNKAMKKNGYKGKYKYLCSYFAFGHISEIFASSLMI